MLAILSFALMQTASPPPVPVIHDAPPSMLLAGYDQCLRIESEVYLPEQIAPEQIFENVHVECAFWLDAAFTKLELSNLITNVSLQKEKAKIIEIARQATIRFVIFKRTNTTNVIGGDEPSRR